MGQERHLIDSFEPLRRLIKSLSCIAIVTGNRARLFGFLLQLLDDIGVVNLAIRPIVPRDGGSLESSGGGVSVSIDPQVGLAIDASGNSVHAAVPITVQGEISNHHLRGNLGSGGQMLRVRTSGGSVSIKPL